MVITQRDSFKGSVTIPGDRSISHRAVILSSLAKGETEINGFSMTEDCLSTIDCFRKMGAIIDILPGDKIKVAGKGLYGLKASPAVLNAGKSGTTIRLLLGVLAGQQFTSVITRDDSLVRKPIGKVVEVLRMMGAGISARENGNYCPMTVTPASLKGLTHELAAEDAYIKSPMLIASLYSEGETRIIEAVRSRDHSELMLRYLGADVDIQDGSVSCRQPDNLYSRDLVIPGDISIAAYFITAALIIPDAKITVNNTGINATRTQIIDVYRAMGANITISNERTFNNEPAADITVETSKLKGTVIEPHQIPLLFDEIPVLTVAASLAEGITEFKGLWSCHLKEMTRVRAIVLELRKMGALIKETEDGLVIEGVPQLRGTIVDCSNDHSLAMALSIAGLAAKDETMVKKSHVLDATYPEFMEVLNKL